VSLAERLTRLGELLVTMSGSPVPTHLFQTLADNAGGPLPNDYLAVCLADAEQGGGPGYPLVRRHPTGQRERAFDALEQDVSGEAVGQDDAISNDQAPSARRRIPCMAGYCNGP